MSRSRIDRRAALRQHLLIAVLLGSLAGGAFLMLHLIAASDAHPAGASEFRDGLEAQGAARKPGGGIQPTWPILAGYLALTAAFVAVCCRRPGQASSASPSTGGAMPSASAGRGCGEGQGVGELSG